MIKAEFFYNKANRLNKKKTPQHKVSQMPLPMDLFTLIIPQLSFEDMLVCTAVCKEWHRAAQYVTVSKIVNVHYFPSQLRLLQRIRVDGLNVFSRRDINRLFEVYNESFTHTKFLTFWAEEEALMTRGSFTVTRNSPHSMELMQSVEDRALGLVSSMNACMFTSLLTLRIGNLILNPQGCIQFACALQNMPVLHQLILRFLYFTGEGDDGVVWDAMDSMPHLDDLELSMVRGQSQLRRVPSTLKRLQTHRVGLSGENAMYLMSSLPANIETVKMHGFWNDFSAGDSVMFQYENLNLSQLKCLHTLHLENIDMAPSDLHHLLDRKLPNSLTRLEVACNFLGGGGFKRAFDHGVRLPPSLTWLDLSHNNMTDVDMRTALAPYCIPSLETLILDGNHCLFGHTAPSPLLAIAVCDTVQFYATRKLKRIGCNNCGWDELDTVTRRPKYPAMLALTATSSVWGGLYEKKCGVTALTYLGATAQTTDP